MKEARHMHEQSDPVTVWSVEAILANNGRTIVPSDGPGRHSWHKAADVEHTGSHRALEVDDLDTADAAAAAPKWQVWLARYGLIPPVTAGR